MVVIIIKKVHKYIEQMVTFKQLSRNFAI
jgi:hypothetical protein